MAVEITQLLRQKLELLTRNPNLKSEAEKSRKELKELKKSLKGAVSVQVSDQKKLSMTGRSLSRISILWRT